MLDAYYEFRELVVDELRKDLLGPRSEREVLSDAPSINYSAGILFPKRLQADNILPSTDTRDAATPTSESDGGESDEGDPRFREDYQDDTDDPPVALANVKFPSSMGITFAVASGLSKEIRVRLSAGVYKKNGDGHWVRTPITSPELCIDISEPRQESLSSLLNDDCGNDMPGLDLYVRVRRADRTGVVAVTAVLINTLSSARELDERENNSFFQPKIVVTAPDDIPAFVERPLRVGAAQDPDRDLYRLLYRHAKDFAIGHGCAATWSVSEDVHGHATRIESEHLPTHRLNLSDSNPNIDNEPFAMSALARGNRSDTCDLLDEFAENYKQWIGEQKQQLDTDNELQLFRHTAETNLGQCTEAYERIRRGVSLLRRNENAWESFVLMNRSMLTQRARSVWIADGRPETGPTETEAHRWRPFQIAFILMCIEGIAEPRAEVSGRDLLDLLWFPTGGGKTEAYLGLIAFTIFHRRLANPDAGGVTALMRYTLRLLTIQQFERAAILICACEKLRRENPSRLGTDPISLGTWLGKDVTPLTLAQTRNVLNDLQAGAVVNKGNPVQLQSCPWCGKSLNHTNYWIRDVNPQLVISCNNLQCDFKTALPVFLIDEDIYNKRPSLIIATVDKFASLPWKEECGSIFNIEGAQRTAPPPELIIQDELHLISGPLGSMVGLYETVVDELCSSSGVRPKIVASTATIRRAGNQSLRLFGRDMRQFPPPALDARDSYFAIEAGPTEKGDRMYVGLMAPSNSHATLLVRTYSALLQAVHEFDADDYVKDQYWTLVGYFTSLRVLGGARLQVQDDVDDRINLIASRSGHDKRELTPAVELTSNVPAREIPVRLKELSQQYPGAVDVLLATNMISVGVDIDRLGLMAVMGQPQSTSEYIQATSRVGRRYPGLVVTLYSPARSRDRSHYESFVSYHSALYRQVEATSVTPFSAGARARALHAVLIALARHTHPNLVGNDAAAAPDLVTLVQDIRQVIRSRVEAASVEETAGTMAQLDVIIQEWQKRANDNPHLRYSDRNDINRSLLKSAQDVLSDDMFITLWSMRAVDQSSNLFILN